MSAQPEHLEARVARLEASSAHLETAMNDIKTDLRDLRQEVSTNFRMLYRLQITILLSLIALFVAGFSALSGMMARGFGWL